MATRLGSWAIRFAGIPHTRGEDSPWWEVDLGGEQAIDRMVIWNRSNSVLYKRMNHFRVRVLDHSRKVVFERVIEHAPSPSIEIVPLACLAKGIPGPTGEDQPLALQLPQNLLKDVPSRLPCFRRRQSR